MQILQLDVEKISYELIKPESSIYEDSNEKKAEIEDALVLLVSIEAGDTNELAEKAISDATEFMSKLKRKRLVLYPFAHLSSNLEKPKAALALYSHMREFANGKGIELHCAPFGWNKKLSIAIKGHPLAEQSRSYSVEAKEAKQYKKAKPVSIDTAIVRKSDISGLPETDHRTIGERLDLYSFQEVSPGMVYWHKNGKIIFNELVRFLKEILDYYDYNEISTPVLANIALWHVSGHIEHYKENMFIFESEGESLGMKPMNCPSTILIYKSRKWSYKELPFRTAIFDKVYRNEV
ncbi:MAG: threonyl-tRNA synthetase editing domain-containing protein, partial [Candidatus Micrarchaeaceae archaeon]